MALSAQAVSFSPATEGFPGSSASEEKRNIQNRQYSARPVDLVHLARQSLGDRALELEILSLFMGQSALYIDRLANATTADERKMAAHTILGSARGIGAWSVADAAEKVELSAKSASDLTELRIQLDATNAFIAELLTDI